MKLGLFKRIAKEDLGGTDIPDWVDGLLGVLNQNMENISTAMTGRLTFSDNFYSSTTQQTFTHNKQLIVNPGKSNTRVIGVIPIYAASGYQIASFASVQQQNGSLGITLGFLNSDGSAVAGTPQVKCTVLILFG